MTKWPLSLYQSHEAKELDRLAIAKIPITAYQLMNRAGQSALDILLSYWPQAKSIAVFCGTGNNGGDGYVLARLAKAKGLQVKVYQVGTIDENKLSPEAKLARDHWLELGENTTHFSNQALREEIIIDALLGTGMRASMPEEFQNAIIAINQSKKPVLAMDLPSGLNPDLGSYDEPVIHATVTVTFIVMKIGLICSENVDVVGQLHFESLGVNSQDYPQIKPTAYRLDYEEVMSALLPRRLSSHKGDNGHVCIIGGGHSGFSGAVCLAGEASLRSGAGLVSAIVAPQSLALLARSVPELMCYGFSGPEESTSLLQRATVMVLGPGLSQNEWGETFFHWVLQKWHHSMIVDADGLNWLAKFPQFRDNWILTPHPGEASRMLGVCVSTVQKDRVQAAKALQEKFGGTIVLKGAGTVILDQTGEITINAGGVPALATGGTGDVLSGLIAGLVAQKIPLSMAAKIAVSVHTLAAQIEQSLGTRGMLASDLFLHIRNLLNGSKGV